MSGIKNNCRQWSELLYSDLISNSELFTRAIKTKTKKSLADLGIINRCANGYSILGLPKTEEQNTGIRINYTDAFREILNRGTFNPAEYLLLLVKQFYEGEYDVRKLNGFLARGLRSLSSFLREPDVEENLFEILKQTDPNCMILNSEFQDTKEHTDVFLKYNNEFYRIWMYQFSKRGLPHDIERITGQRGELPNGIHVLCPLKTQFALEYENVGRRLERASNSTLTKKEKVGNLSDRAVISKQKLNSEIEALEQKIFLEETLKQKLFETMNSELEIINGWYFYSQQHIKRIADQIEGRKRRMKYEYVKNILTAPEKLLSETQIFIK